MVNCFETAKLMIAIPRKMPNVTVKGKRLYDEDAKKTSIYGRSNVDIKIMTFVALATEIKER